MNTPSDLNLDEYIEYLRQSARESINNRDFKNAVNYYKEALKYIPNQIQFMGEICWILGRLKDQYEDEAYLEEMLQYAKKALVIAQKRTSKDNIGRFYYYIAQYYKVKGYDNNMLAKEYELAGVFSEAKKFKDIANESLKLACDYLDLSIANKPYFLSNYIDKGICKNSLDKPQEALDLYEYVKEEDEEFADETGVNDLIVEAKANDGLVNKELIYLKLGLEYEKRGNYKDANKQYYIAIHKNPKHIPSLFILFQNEIKLNSDKNKIISIGEYLYSLLNEKDNKPDSPYFLENICSALAECYKYIGNADKVGFHLMEYDYNCCLNRARKAKKENDLEKALEEYKKALEIHNNDYDLLIDIINICFNLNKLDDVMDYCAMGLESAKEKNDKNYIAKFQYYIGCKLDETNYDKAVEFYEFALQTADDLKEKLLYCRKIAFFYFYRNKLETSLDYFKKCKDIIQSGAHDTYDIDSEIIKIEELLDKNSDLNRMNEHYDIGAQYFNAMNFEDAAKEMEVALSFVPQDLQALDVLNRALYRIKQYDRCFEVAHEGYLISLRDHDYRFLDMFCYNLGNILYNSGKPDEALKYYKCALNIKPYDTDYLYFVGACHRNLGDYVEALRIFNIAHNIDPEDKGIAEQLDFCMNKLKLIESSFPK